MERRGAIPIDMKTTNTVQPPIKFPLTGTSKSAYENTGETVFRENNDQWHPAIYSSRDFCQIRSTILVDVEPTAVCMPYTKNSKAYASPLLRNHTGNCTGGTAQSVGKGPQKVHNARDHAALAQMTRRAGTGQSLRYKQAPAKRGCLAFGQKTSTSDPIRN